ncbi:hydantoinase/oxoprolinase family protein [Candidatus Acetothermia bacterium]|jgi:N-methylhydantoinase A|nr:hydantoinase/oxoprolinase family protein [Candidatus Acetothermia bacterium]MCI2432701.1 hydantoinase/oxoprolinase family protein [Candidatus Acetothermia bacterium]MCI2435791.1 hydantoinase/oxoprolinase family protein [Candidatus Acetothermia bacterium]
MAGLSIGTDVGGTFTDFVALNEESGELYGYKRLSTRPPDRGILDGLRELAQLFNFTPTEIKNLLHGSTVATNALLEKRLARTALLTTEGFRDILEIGRQDRPKIYDWNADRPEPLVPRSLRFGVPERLDYQGNVLKRLDLSVVVQIAEQLRRARIESVAVCYLFSYLDPEHERQTGALLRSLLKIPVTLSSELLPEHREYERTATTVLNAALRPMIEEYLSQLAAKLHKQGVHADLQIMQSNGGLTTVRQAGERAVQMLFSGPAAGVAGARYVAVQAGFGNVITLDMGGTSTDVSLIREGQIAWRPEGLIAGRPVRLPMVEIQSIGAGGGSIAWLDAGGILRVGPQSAGADPGPACYGKSELPTVTDAQLVLGRLDPESPLGEQSLDLPRAQAVITEKIASPLKLSLEKAALGILEIADAQMERAIRLMTVERGLDPRDFTLLVFGGAGPLHGSSLARRLKIKRLLVPQLSGLLSALGLLVSEPVQDLVQTFVHPLETLKVSEIASLFARLQNRAQERLHGFAQIEYLCSVDLRYRGQSYELNIELDSQRGQRPHEWAALFHQSHTQAYGYALPERPVEIVNLRLRAVGRRALPDLFRKGEGLLAPIVSRERSRAICFAEYGWLKSAIYSREELAPECELCGPALVVGRESTVLVEPSQRAFVDKFGNLLIEAL